MLSQQQKELLKDWAFVRSETIEILSTLNDKKLQFCPEGSKKWQPLSYQFACIGRTQLVYAKGLMKGSLSQADFTGEGLPQKRDIITKDEIERLLEWSDTEWLSALSNGMVSVAWTTDTLSRAAHLYRLVAHERLHHGQLISYFTLAGFTLPKHFRQNWAL